MTTRAIGFELTMARRRAGLTQLEIARRMGTSQSAVCRVEVGKGQPSLDFLERYANALGAPLVIEFGKQTRSTDRQRRSRVRRVLGDYIFDPWERDPKPAEQRALEADGLTRERFKRQAATG